MSSKRIRMFVFNNCANDARVLKESASLVKAGHSVEVVAFLDSKTVPQELRDGVLITRIKTNPLNQRLIRFLGNPLHYRPSWLKRKVRIPRSSMPKLRRRPRFFREFRVVKRRAEYKAMAQLGIDEPQLSEAKKQFRRRSLRLVGKRPWLLLQVVVYLIGLGIFKGTYLTISLVKRTAIRTKRRVKNSIQWFSKNVFQKVIKWFFGPIHRWFVYYDYYRKAKAYSLKEPMDVYHCHDLNTFFLGIVLKRKQGAKLIYDSHELYLHKNRMRPPSRFKTWMLRRIETRGMKVADRVITVGECIADWMAEEYNTVKPEVIINAPHHRDEVTSADPHISLRSALNIADDTFLLIYSGGITFNRGLEYVIDAVERIDGIHFVMLGYGTEAYMDTLRKRIKDLNAGYKISFFGPVQHHEVASYLSSADCGIAPIWNICLSYYYCSPNKLFEYIQAQLPVVASNFPEMEKVVNDSDIGFTFDPHNVDSIEQAIRSMMNEPEKRKIFAQNTQEAAKKYRWAVEEQKLKMIYEAL